MDAQENAKTASRAGLRKAFLVSFVALSAYLVLVAPALAQAPPGIPTPMGFVLCRIVEMVYGNMGRGLATLAIIVVGVGATLGKVSWGLAITVGVGIAVIFNASPILSSLSGGVLSGSCY